MELQCLVDLFAIGDDRAADHVAVTTEVLGRGVDDHIRPQGQRLLKVRRGKCVVDDDEGVVDVGEFGDPRNVQDLEVGVGRRLEQYQPRASRHRGISRNR